MTDSDKDKNCIGYVFFKLGIDKVEKFRCPTVTEIKDLKRHFQMTDESNADALAIIGRVDFEVRVVHMAVRNGLLPASYEHRACCGAPVEKVNACNIPANGSFSRPQAFEWAEVQLKRVYPRERKIFLKLIR